MLRVVHFSDWHGQFYPLPEADLYICTGDMLKNYPEITRGRENFEKFGTFEYENERIIPSREVKNQTGWLEKRKRNGGLRKFLASKNAPVITVRGNHCFVDYGHYFGEPFFEINLDSSRYTEYFGLKIGGFRGIAEIAGEWSDELDEPTIRDRIEKMPADLDIVVSHTPPWGIMDNYFGSPYGSKPFSAYLNRLSYTKDTPTYFFFGHCHHGAPIQRWVGEKIFCSNAATGHNIIEI